MDPSQTPAQRRYHDRRERLLRREILGRFYIFRQHIRHEFGSFEFPPEFGYLEALMSGHEREMGVRQQEISWGFNSMDELTDQLHRYQEERPSFFDGSRTDVSDFMMGILLFQYFMRLADDERRGQHNETTALVPPDLDPTEDFMSDVARWDQFRLRSEDHERTMLSGILAGLPAVDTATLAEDEQSCTICTNRYTNIFIPSSTTTASSAVQDPEIELAVRLRCLHVLGIKCLIAWLQGGNRTCPFCRANVEDDTATINNNNDKNINSNSNSSNNNSSGANNNNVDS